MQINLDVDVIRDLLVMRGWEVRLEGGGFRYVRPEAYGRDAHNLKPVEDFLWHADEALQQCLQGEAASGQHTVGLNGRTVAVKVDLAFER